MCSAENLKGSTVQTELGWVATAWTFSLLFEMVREFSFLSELLALLNIQNIYKYLLFYILLAFSNTSGYLSN